MSSFRLVTIFFAYYLFTIKVMSSPPNDDVHKRVQRLSITVDDIQDKEAHSNFILSLKQSKENNHDVIQEEPTGSSDSNSGGIFNLNNVNKIKNSTNNMNSNNNRRRRRSSASSLVSQVNVLRKKKFLNKDPSFRVKDDIQKKVTISSLRDLIMYALSDVNTVPRWCDLENRKCVNKVVVLFLRGLVESDLGVPSLSEETNPVKFVADEKLSVLNEKFSEVIPFMSPGSKKCIFSTYTSLVSYSLSPKEREQIKKDNENKKITLPDLFLTLDDLLAYGYPIHSGVKNATKEMIEKTSDYVETLDFTHGGSRTFALDCEMCKSLTGKVLARVSLIDFNNNVLIDEYIKPDDEIVDYLTQWSGITPEKLHGVETTLEDIQKQILKYVSSNDTLIGHSLESDLEVLKMKHPKIIDTSICFDHQRGPPAKPSLKSLMSQHLNRDVQVSIEGHNPVEDCISCMDLIKLKVEKGYLYGRSYNTESLYSRLAKSNKHILNSDGEKIPKTSLVIDYSVPRSFGQNFETRFQARNDDEVVSLFKEHQPDHDLIILKLRELEWFKDLAGDPKPDQVNLPQTKEEMYSIVNQRLQEIYDSLEPNTIFVITTENNDTKEMIRLQSIQKAFNAKYQNGDVKMDPPTPEEDWTEEKSLALTNAIKHARDTLLLATLKPKDTL